MRPIIRASPQSPGHQQQPHALPGAGVDYLHTSGLIHGDLKTANVLLRSTGTDSRGFTCKVRAPAP